MSLALRSPLVRTVVASIHRIYNPGFADSTWDNTGLLLEPPARTDLTASLTHHRLLLTIDITRAVVDEAIRRQTSFIITYHPIIFGGLKSITNANSQQESLLRLAQAGISVYSPHTSVDAAPGGLGDWLADGIGAGNEDAEETRNYISPIMLPGGDFGGMGRKVEFTEEVEFSALVDKVKKFLGLEKVCVAVAERHRTGGEKVKKVALCAGSGGSVFKGLTGVDVFFTGEFSHHEALAAVERGISVITCFHTNTERGFLKAVMQPKLTEVLALEWDRIPEEERSGKKGFEVEVSTADRDPYDIV